MAENKKFRNRFTEWLEQRIPLDPRELLGLLSFTGLIYGPIDKRLSIRETIEATLKKPVPKHVTWTFCFGGITMFLFMLQAITGILLSLYYKSSPDAAYDSVQYIMNNVPLGWLMRQLHAWGAHLMVLMVLLHMMRVFFYGAYKPPREMNWMVGVILLFLTFTFSLTGYLLPWDSLSYAGSAVGTGIIGSMPFIGKYMLLIARGGETVSAETLSRFFAMHVIILPAVTAMLIAVHLIMVRRQGISGPL